MDSWGIWLGATGTFVDDNAIDGGCATGVSIGVYAEDSWARLQNNRISGGGCNIAPIAAGDSIGLDVRVADGGNEIDVHSNTIDGGGLAGTCASTGARIDATTPAPTAGVGIFRNNIIRSGLCSTKNDFVEAGSVADPRVFQNNDLDPTGSPTALYVDEGTMVLTTFGAVDALADMTVGGTISADPLFVAFPADLHISSGSPCDGFGTPAGAPATDMDGDARSSTAPDIGADEI